jgi:hypothetical protein
MLTALIVFPAILVILAFEAFRRAIRRTMKR